MMHFGEAKALENQNVQYNITKTINSIPFIFALTKSTLTPQSGWGENQNTVQT